MTTTLDLRTVTAEQAIDAMITVEALRVPASELRPGDRVVFHMDGAYHVDTITGVFGEDSSAHWLAVWTKSGTNWKCSPKNRMCLRIVA